MQRISAVFPVSVAQDPFLEKMSASQQAAQVATVLAERNQAGVMMYMPNLQLLTQSLSQKGAGAYTLRR